MGIESLIPQSTFDATKEAQEKIKKEKEGSKFDERTTIDIQCFLIDNLEQVVSQKVSSEEDKYQTFVMISSKGGGPANVVQELLGRKGIQDFFNISSAQKALLIPKIEIYKAAFQEGQKDTKLVFNDHLRIGEISSITSNKKGRGDDVGLKSFIYELAGTQPAEGSFINCTLVMYFTNAAAFLEKRENNIAFSDLIFDKANASDAGVAYDPKRYRAKIIAGWAVPSDKVGLFSKDLLKIIDRTKTILYVTHKDHEMDFSEDGTLTVTIKFVGTMETALYDPHEANIFSKTTAGLQAESLKKTENNMAKDPSKPLTAGTRNVHRSGRDAVFDLDGLGGDLRGMKVVEVSGEKVIEQKVAKPNTLETTRHQIQALEIEDNQEKHSRLINKLYEEAAIYYVDIDRGLIEDSEKYHKDLLQKYNTTDDKVKENKELKDRIEKEEMEVRASARRSSRVEVRRVATQTEKDALKKKQKLFETSNGDLQNTAKINKENQVAESVSKSDEEKKKAIQQFIRGGIDPIGDNKVRAHFLYFGDLLDVLFSMHVFNRSDVDPKALKILVGSLVYKDPRTKVQKEISIADIPIAMERFVPWFLKKYVSTGTQLCLVGSFIKDIMMELIMTSLGGECYGTRTEPGANIYISAVSVAAEGKEPLNGVKNGDRVGVKELIYTPGRDALHKSDSSLNTKIYNYIYIFASNYTLAHAGGNEKKDNDMGVYHLAPGLDKGLVKSIKFKKSAIQYLAEAQVTSQDKEGKVSPNVYNATVKMLGNNFFTNGIHVYVDTLRMNMGSPFKNGKKNELPFVYHLGGYYLVTKVLFELTDGDYETSLECRWNNGRDGDGDKFTVMGNENKANTKVSPGATNKWFDDEATKKK